ncbi:FAD:protein FMN transferase [Actinoplanes sp. TBRC 11911]|uniref:FAD:protein FMN transferase n=1 Tax=Actinoplanes sp. TBRC 11911 TaxID=2729386 RepID=UPI00145F3CA2|nr:FAD:protein FMN transferase [Actinoplanes sp. TBRC 11911]NMO54582.1 FAD:protein FMN transferase [Actinoplanes sp. TBRC 11911]
MPLVETLPVGADTAQWTVWGTTARIVLTDPALVAPAAALVRAELDAVDAACSRFRDDSELSRACRAGRARVSPLLATLLEAALRAAGQTDGDVSPTVGNAMSALGYDRDFAAVRERKIRVFPSADWRDVHLDGNELTVPDGVRLDLGATAKAVAADRAAALVADRLGTGVLVALGGDIATAGPAPAGGWRVLVQDRPGDPRCTVAIPAGAALATSSTVSRAWGDLHHILDPRTGHPAATGWRTVSVVAPTCLLANTLSTAAIVRGEGATRLLAGVPSRLVTRDRAVLRLGGWPA